MAGYYIHGCRAMLILRLPPFSIHAIACDRSPEGFVFRAGGFSPRRPARREHAPVGRMSRGIKPRRAGGGNPVPSAALRRMGSPSGMCCQCVVMRQLKNGTARPQPPSRRVARGCLWLEARHIVYVAGRQDRTIDACGPTDLSGDATALVQGMYWGRAGHYPKACAGLLAARACIIPPRASKQANTKSVVPVVRPVFVAIGRARVPAIVDPRAATQHTNRLAPRWWHITRR
jgi:hypothetical protein